MTKLSRKQIKEGLDQVPMDVLLTGTRNSRLTHKQKEFAKELALGNTKAGAYRKAYDTKANKKVQANKGSELSLRDDIQVEVEAIRQAIEFNKCVHSCDCAQCFQCREPRGGGIVFIQCLFS